MTESSWSALSIDDVRGLLEPTEVSWWIAGGVAIDLFVGRHTRPHEDIDVQILRGSETAVARQLAGWELYTAKEGRLTSWSIDDNAHVIWCRPTATAPWALELLVADIVDNRWTYRRDHRVSRSIEELGDRTGEGVPFLRPEIQLLYKSKRVRTKDEADFRVALPLLGDPARAWLRDALMIA
ncbi:MAG: amino acid transporter, partial [Kofleriaceae bacterium]|nr:amino acid transporter [Kofleriaceae bacterium]